MPLRSAGFRLKDFNWQFNSLVPRRFVLRARVSLAIDFSITVSWLCHPQPNCNHFPPAILQFIGPWKRDSSENTMLFIQTSLSISVATKWTLFLICLTVSSCLFLGVCRSISIHGVRAIWHENWVCCRLVDPFFQREACVESWLAPARMLEWQLPLEHCKSKRSLFRKT